MKKIISIFILFLCFKNTQAQTVFSLNADLRALFSPLAKPAPPRLFLYDMAGHFVDSSLFVSYNNTDVITTDTWFKMYEEMRNCAYDTTTMLTADSLYTNTMQNYPDTLNMVMMSYDYYTFIDSALTTDTYFYYDTVNTILTDKPIRPGYPFNINTVFSACPNKSELETRNCTFRTDPAFILKDNFSLLSYGEHELIIDFGDGNGWHTVNETSVSYFNVVYPSSGDYEIKTALQNANGIQYLSKSKIHILTDIVEEISPDDQILLPGITANVYNPCTDVAQPYEKIIIYLEGIDIMDVVPGQNRTASRIYAEMIEGEGLDVLQQFGYTIIVVDWHNSRKDMRINAIYLEHLLDYLKCKQKQMKTDEQFVILGESMGGVIARYCLTLMETHPSECEPGKLHNTRLLITLDSPHRGANVPLSLQHFYRVIGGGIMGEFNTITQKVVGKSWNLFLDATAAQQLLMYHCDTYNSIPSYSPYGPHPAKAWFDADLLLLGNYPKYCKMMAMSNGSIAGHGQTSVWNAGVERTPNDKLLYINSDINIRVLHHNFKIAGTTIDLKTNPNGNGNIATITHGTWFVKIKLKWFGIKLIHGFNSLVGKYYDGNTLPLCTSSGGVWGADGVGMATNGIISLNQTFGLGDAQFQNNGNGSFSVLNNTGSWFHGLLGSNNNTTVASDGFHWNFIPTASALDYATTKLKPDIENETIANKVALNPFAIITGITNNYPDGAGGIYLHNRDHLFLKNDLLLDIKNNPQLYDSCDANGRITLLNREIGDNEMWVENRELPWHGTFSTQNEMNVNRRSRYYQYIGSSTPQTVVGVYSKKHPLHIDLITGHALFKVNGGMWNLNYLSPFSGSYNTQSTSWRPCCADSNIQLKNSASLLQNINNRIISIFPNPVNSQSFTISINNNTSEQYTIQIFNNIGQIVFSKTIPTQKIEKQIKIPINFTAPLAEGMYNVSIHSNEISYNEKLLINK